MQKKTNTHSFSLLLQMMLRGNFHIYLAIVPETRRLRGTVSGWKEHLAEGASPSARCRCPFVTSQIQYDDSEACEKWDGKRDARDE